MTYVFGALLGICWGAVGAIINSRIIKVSISKNTVNAITAGNMARMLVDAGFLFTAFLLRNVLPLNFVANMVGVAAGLSIGNIIFSFILAKPETAPTDSAKAEKTVEAATKYAELTCDVEESTHTEVAAEPVKAVGSTSPVETAKEKEIRELKERLAQLEAEQNEK